MIPPGTRSSPWGETLPERPWDAVAAKEGSVFSIRLSSRPSSRRRACPCLSRRRVHHVALRLWVLFHLCSACLSPPLSVGSVLFIPDRARVTRTRRYALTLREPAALGYGVKRYRAGNTHAERLVRIVGLMSRMRWATDGRDACPPQSLKICLGVDGARTTGSSTQ